MLTNIVIENFKTLESVTIPLGQNVVLVGPNNSGKTSTLQALTLWQAGLRAWAQRRSGNSQARQRVGVTLNRKDLTHTPVSNARDLWSGRKVTVSRRSDGKPDTKPVYLKIVTSGESNNIAWQIGFEFYFANQEALYCRPVGDTPSDEVIKLGLDQKIALLPPMSGLVSEEPELQAGRIEVLLGEGQTAQVLRNLCLHVFEKDASRWSRIVDTISEVFGVVLGEPARDQARGAVTLSYKQNDITLDLPSAGRGLQQTLLLMAHLHANPGATVLLDEPDAHLEILRQRQLYNLISDFAVKSNSQIISASHSEVILQEAADRDVVVAFVGRPHRIDDRGSQLLKSLRSIGFADYYQAERKGAVLYFEGATDLSIIREFSNKISHPVSSYLKEPFVKYFGNQPKKVEEHYYGLREANPNLRSFALFDRLQNGVPPNFNIPHHCWSKREIENYFCTPVILQRFASSGLKLDDLIELDLGRQRIEIMNRAIEKISGALLTLGEDPWSDDFKVSDRFLTPLFRSYYLDIKLDNKFDKSDFHILVPFIEPDEINIEVIQVLDKIYQQINMDDP